MGIKKRSSLGCFGWLIHFILGIIIISGTVGFLTTQKIEIHRFLNEIKAANLPGILDSVEFGMAKENTLDIAKKEIIEVEESSVLSLETTPPSSITYEPFMYSETIQLELGNFDRLGRATYAHIQLKNSDEPKGKGREDKITYDPVGWHNYKFKYLDEDNVTKEAYLMNRGHLIGYQFSGLNSEGRNLVPMTRYLNAGTISDKGMDASNYNSMLFYENRLDDWLEINPDYSLDLMVVPNYMNDELIPRTIIMYWTGFDNQGNQIEVNLLQKGLSSTYNKISIVELENKSPNANIDYLTGQATSNF
ncbi:TPA: DNA/RNA non-specific endonuclease [Streptococcus suis]